MEDQLWNLFRETGDPMSYLLYAAGKKQKKAEKDKADAAEKQPPAQPTAVEKAQCGKIV